MCLPQAQAASAFQFYGAEMQHKELHKMMKKKERINRHLSRLHHRLCREASELQAGLMKVEDDGRKGQQRSHQE